MARAPEAERHGQRSRRRAAAMRGGACHTLGLIVAIYWYSGMRSSSTESHHSGCVQNALHRVESAHAAIAVT